MPAIRPLELFYAHAFGRITDDGAQYTGAWRYTLPRVPLVFSIYCGILVPLLAILGMVMRARGWLATIVLGLLSYLLAIGGAAYLRVVRYPEKFVLFGLFALIAFAATTLDRFDRRIVLAAIAITLVDLGLHVGELAPRGSSTRRDGRWRTSSSTAGSGRTGASATRCCRSRRRCTASPR
jgi:hypothetical protein